MSDLYSSAGMLKEYTDDYIDKYIFSVTILFCYYLWNDLIFFSRVGYWICSLRSHSANSEFSNLVCISTRHAQTDPLCTNRNFSGLSSRSRKTSLERIYNFLTWRLVNRVLDFGLDWLPSLIYLFCRGREVSLIFGWNHWSLLSHSKNSCL